MIWPGCPQPNKLGPAQGIEEALETPGFMEQGGTLAFGCQHAYPHHSRALHKASFEAQLKGADACLMAVAQDLGWK